MAKRPPRAPPPPNPLAHTHVTTAAESGVTQAYFLHKSTFYTRVLRTKVLKSAGEQ